jgi:phosphate starvation-inducible protein PhoH and related proteins
VPYFCTRMKEMTISLGAVDPVLFFGTNNNQLNLLRENFPDVRFISRGTELKMHGSEAELNSLQIILMRILREIQVSGHISMQRYSEIIETVPKVTKPGEVPESTDPVKQEVLVHGPNSTRVIAKTQGQHEMVAAASQNDILFCIGPAGTGKTYTAVALAVRAFKEKEVRKIVLVRPAVEAGESLGFLPGDLKEKIDPYLRPLYDALEDMIPPEKLAQYLEKNIIEIVPLAYMRGRTLNHSFIILDEAQNATEAQLKMFLTRMGTGSKIIVTGDQTQVDLPKSQKSGLIQASDILQGIKGIAFVYLQPTDVLRHRLIRKILEAYDNL